MKFHSLLLVDAGNTLVKWAVAHPPGSKLSPTLRVSGEMPTPEATPARVRALKKAHDGHFLVLSSVVPKLTSDFARVFQRGFHSVSGESPVLGFGFDYPKPAELGADRLAAAVAAHADKTWPAIIVSCGTATAFTVVDAKGRFCGGTIAPGLQTQLAALLGATAQLPEVKIQSPESALAKSTQEAIRAGVMLNFLGGVKEIIHQLSAALPGRKKPIIILTGGHAHHLTMTLEVPHTLRPLLVFEGLRIIGHRVWPHKA